MIKIIPDKNNKIRIFRKSRWPKGVFCPRCNSANVSIKSKNNDGLNIYYCANCRKQKKQPLFTDLTGSIFHKLKIPFGKLCLLIHFFSENYSASRTADAMKKIKYPINKKTVFRIFHLFRESIKNDTNREYFSGNLFELDEVYISAKLHTKKYAGYKTHKQLRLEGIKRGTGSELQTPVFTIISKNKNWIKKNGKWKIKYNWNVRFEILDKVNTQTLKKTITQFIPISKLQFCTIETDTHQGYNFLKRFNHKTVKHSAKEYVSQSGATINCAESWHSWIKTVGFRIYRMISRKYLLNYLYEFASKLRSEKDEDDFVKIFGYSF